MDELQTGNPVRLEIAGYINANPWAEMLERSFHRLLDRERVEGEWFIVSERTAALMTVLGILNYDPRVAGGDGRPPPSWVLAYRARAVDVNKKQPVESRVVALEAERPKANRRAYMREYMRRRRAK